MIKYTLLLYFSLSGLYLWQSGLPQLSHIILLIIIYIYSLFINRLIFKVDFLLLAFFVIYSFGVNIVFYCIYFDIQFLTSTFQIIFNGIIFIFLYSLLHVLPKSKQFVLWGIVLAYLIQWLVLMLGLGETKFFPRYAGTFNDPNQMAYWFIATLVCYYLLREKSSGWLHLFISGSFLIFVVLSFSRSAFLGLLFYIVGLAVLGASKNLKLFFFSILLIFGIASVLFLSNIENGGSNKKLDIIVDRVFHIDFKKQADERGYTRFTEFPEYMLLGSGQGEHKRFNRLKDPSYLNVEMHTSWGGLLFYYGLPGFISIFLLIVFGLGNLSGKTKLLVLSTFVYGLTTYSFRTPIFWVLLSVVYYVNEMNKEIKN